MPNNEPIGRVLKLPQQIEGGAIRAGILAGLFGLGAIDGPGGNQFLGLALLLISPGAIGLAAVLRCWRCQVMLQAEAIAESVRQTAVLEGVLEQMKRRQPPE